MKRKTLAALCCVALIFILQGCQLALEDIEGIPHDAGMIGVFITTEHLDLFDFEGFINDNLKGFSGGELAMDGDTAEYQGRVYATLTTDSVTNEETGERVETREYVFEDIAGIPYFAARMVFGPNSDDSYIASTSDEAISDGGMSIDYRDDVTTTTLEGTIYVTPSAQSRSYFFNPVFQSADGSVYLESGTGMTAPLDYEGATMSQRLDSTVTVTENGESTTQSLNVTVYIKAMSVAERMVLLQMDADNALISRTVYYPGNMPETITPQSLTEYIIVETHKQGEEPPPAREIYGRDAETIEYFTAGEDGVCVKRAVGLEWK